MWNYLSPPRPDPEWDEYIRLRAAGRASFFDDPMRWRDRLRSDPGFALADAIDYHIGLLESNALVPGNYPEESAHAAFVIALQYAHLLLSNYQGIPALPDRWEHDTRVKLMQLKEWCRCASAGATLSASFIDPGAYQILLRRMCEVAVPAAKASRKKRRSNAVDPTAEALKSGYADLLGRDVQSKLTANEIVALYGLGNLPVAQFCKSSRYVQGSSHAMKPWLLPHVPGRAKKKRDRSTKAFQPTRWWTVAEVMTAFKGWAGKLKVELPTRF